MPTFRYKAYNSVGRTIAGDIDAAGLKDAVQQLKNIGLYPAKIDEAENDAPAWLFFRKGLSPQSLALTTRQLATLVASGTPLMEALGVLIENTENPGIKKAFARVKESVAEGSSFTRALEASPDVFSPFYRGLAAAGEASGTLDKALPRLADYLETRARVMREVKAALTYPVLMTFVGALVLGFLFVFVIPKITRIFEETSTTLPLITVILLKATGFARAAWPYALALIAALAVPISRFARAPKWIEFRKRSMFKVPWFGKLARDFYITGFTSTLGSLLSSGIQMLKALEITKDALSHPVYNEIIDSAIRDCTAGGSLSSSLKKSPHVPAIVAHMASVGEKGGNLDEMLLRASNAYESEFDAGVKKALHLMEPVLILTMGVVVGFIVLAILLPIFELNQAIR